MKTVKITGLSRTGRLTDFINNVLLLSTGFFRGHYSVLHCPSNPDLFSLQGKKNWCKNFCSFNLRIKVKIKVFD